MKKKNLWLALLLVIGMVAALCTGCASSGNANTNAEAAAPGAAQTDTVSIGEESSEEVSSESDPVEELLKNAMPVNVSTDGTAEVMNVKFTVHGVQLSKTTMGMPAPISFCAITNPAMDKDGTLVNDHSYLLIDISFENIRYYGPGIGLNSTTIAIYNGETRLDDGAHEMALTDGNPEKEGQTDWFIVDEFKQGDTLRCTIGYVVSDEWLAQATDIYLLPTPVNRVEQNHNSFYNVDLWPEGTQFISLNSFMEGLTIPETTYDPPIASRPETVEGAFTYGYEDRYSTEILQVSTTDTLPEEAISFAEPADGAGLTADGTLAEGYTWLQVDVQVEDNIVREDTVIDCISLGWDALYAYRGEERADRLVPYAAAYGENITISYAEQHRTNCDLSAEAPSTFTYYFAVPEDYLADNVDLLLQMVGFDNRGGRYSELYDPDTRTYTWNDESAFVNLSALLTAE